MIDHELSSFDVGIWHPFCPHGLESPEQIISRKRCEIASHGWTLWSFQYRRPQVLEAWRQALSDAAPPALVFCSDSPHAKDPATAETSACKSYRLREPSDGNRGRRKSKCLTRSAGRGASHPRPLLNAALDSRGGQASAGN